MTNETMPKAHPKRQAREPLFHIVKRAPMPWYGSWGIRLGTIAIAMLFCSFISYFFIDECKSFTDMFRIMWEGNFETERRRAKMLSDLSILLCISLAVTPAFRMKFWNIGAEGQVLIGCLASVAAVIYFGDKHNEVQLLIIMFMFAIIASAIWAVIPAIFKAQWDTNETLFTLMMNYVATSLVGFCLLQWVPDGSQVLKKLSQGRLPKLPSSLPAVYDKYLLIIIIVVAITALVYVYLNFTKQGYEISVVGESRRTASYIGISVKKVIIRTMVVSGILCGIAGFLIVSGLDNTVTAESVGGRGFTAIMVSWLGKFNPIFMIFTSFLIIFLETGADRLSTVWKVSDAFPGMIVGIMLFFIIGCEFFINYKIKFRTAHKEV